MRSPIALARANSRMEIGAAVAMLNQLRYPQAARNPCLRRLQEYRLARVIAIGTRTEVRRPRCQAFLIGRGLCLLAVETCWSTAERLEGVGGPDDRGRSLRGPPRGNRTLSSIRPSGFYRGVIRDNCVIETALVPRRAAKLCEPEGK